MSKSSAKTSNRAGRVPRLGPGFLITAAFVGPGTVATASRAGTGFGYALLWAVLFSVLATIVLQEMTARLGVATGGGLSEALRNTLRAGWQRGLAFGLVIIAILFGNSAYQAGNITGAATGLADMTDLSFQAWAVPIALAAWMLLMCGRFDWIQLTLTLLVVAMSLLFVIAAVVARPDWGSIASNLLTPSFPAESAQVLIALVGTTVVPYNLFLHSSSAAKVWGGVPDKDKFLALQHARWDTFVSIVIGGMITASILISAAIARNGEATGRIGEIAQQLEPVLGSASRWVFAVGLFAAGLTSALTAPLAAAFATCGCLGWPTEIGSARFRIVFSAVMATGLATCLGFGSGTSPTELIILAQFANGLLLPIISVFLLLVMNNSRLLHKFTNRLLANLAGGILLLITTGWGVNQLVLAVQKLWQLLD